MPLELRAPVRGSRHAGVRLPLACEADPLLLERLRRPRARAPVVPVEGRVRAGKLRHVLLGGAVVTSLAALAPRALAYFRLYEAATDFANYAVCMAGPAGPTALRQKPAEFWRLVRRRLLAASPESRPFAACAPLVGGLSEGAVRRAPHEAQAQDFREYGAGAQRSRLTIDDLRVSAEELDQLALASWPFTPPSRDEIVRPSRNARAAAHPSELPQPAGGRGLPNVDLGHGTVASANDDLLLVAGRDANLMAYASRDGGLSWAALDRHGTTVKALAGRCGSADAATSFRFESAGEQLRVESWRGAQLEASFPLASLESRMTGVSCDGSAALALIEVDASRPPLLRLCAHAARCRDVTLPAELSSFAGPDTRWSVARTSGASVLSFARAGVVRVISSRDDGETWTPPVVAFDSGEVSTWAQTAAPPARLLALDRRVLLYSGTDSARASYPALASDDLGASWRAFQPPR